jgi:hypothetical protein
LRSHEPANSRTYGGSRKPVAPSALLRAYKDPNPLIPYPYNIHETDGLSRNPDDCVKWGCIDVGNGIS